MTARQNFHALVPGAELLWVRAWPLPRRPGWLRPRRSLGVGSTGGRQDHARRELPGLAETAPPLVPGRCGRRRRGDVLLLPGAGRATPAPTIAALDAGVPSRAGDVQPPPLPGALPAAPPPVRVGLRQLPGRSRLERSARGHGRGGGRAAKKGAADRPQPERAAVRLRPPARGPCRGQHRVVGAALHAGGDDRAGASTRAAPMLRRHDPIAPSAHRRLGRRARAAPGADRRRRAAGAVGAGPVARDPLRLLRGAQHHGLLQGGATLASH